MKKTIATVLALILIPFSAPSIAESTFGIDLSKLNEEQLLSLKAEIDAEIERNHTPNEAGKDAILEATKSIVDAAFEERGISISWAWMNYTYTKSWERYTMSTHIDYRDTENNKQKPDVYAEGIFSDGVFCLTFVRVGSEILLDNPDAVPVATSTPTLSEENHSEPSEGALELSFGELVSLNQTPFTNNIIVKAKIQPSYSNDATIFQNFLNIQALIQRDGFDQYDEIQYWAVADMTSGDEAKVISFTVPKSTIDGIAAEAISANQIQDNVTDIWLHPSLK